MMVINNMVNHICSLLAIFPFLSNAAPQGPPGGVSPTVQSMTFSGPGCPSGVSGTQQIIVNGRPVFLFPDWNLSLPDIDATAQTSKSCTEEIHLVNGPVGSQLRIATITVSGWASLTEGTSVKIEVDTILGGKVAGNQTATITSADLNDAGEFTLPLATQPTDIWSACVAADGVVPTLVIRTAVTLIGSSSTSIGLVGSEDPTDLGKALGIFFTPAWRACA